MKLVGTYVNCEGKYRPVRDLRVDENAQGMLGMYPEDILPRMEFRLGDRMWRKHDQFGIEWPHEQYKLINDKALWGGRKMVKQYKMAPSEDSYQVEGTASLEQWLNAPEPAYSKPNQVLKTAKDLVFTPECAIKTRSATDSTIYVCQREMIQVKRTPKTVTLRPILAKLPGFVTDMFDNLLEKRLEYTGKMPEGVEPDQGWDAWMHDINAFKKIKHFNWMRVADNEPQENLRDWQYCYLTDLVEVEYDGGWEEEDRPVAVLFGYDGEHHVVYDKFDASNFTLRVFEDLRLLLEKGGIDQ
jgi:hypothetical protein